MIPKTIHYCWFGRGEMPQLDKDCIESWHKYMPDWKYKLWNEDNFDVNCNQYVREAYEARKFAFVSDYVRLKALYEEGGLYLDTDVKVLKSFDDLMTLDAFCGIEGSKHKPITPFTMASKMNGEWVKEMLDSYEGRLFLKEDGGYDLTPNTVMLTALMEKNGFKRNGEKQQYRDCTVFPTEWFSPRQTTGELLITENTFSNHLGAASWSEDKLGWKSYILRLIGQKNMTRLIKLKRKLIG